MLWLLRKICGVYWFGFQRLRTFPSHKYIACDKTEYLFLDGNQLHGTIPPHFGQLTLLERLQLNVNSLEGQIPTEIGRLRRLSRFSAPSGCSSKRRASNILLLHRTVLLGLGRNSLDGTLPSELGNLDQLGKSEKL
jgi:hypothetical protein